MAKIQQISMNPIVNKQRLLVNSIRSIFPKDTHEWVNWINQGKGLYYNKEKVLNFLTNSRHPADVAFGFPEVNRVQQEKSKLSELALNSAANVVKSFQNPKLPEEKIIKKATPSAALKRAIDSIDSTSTPSTIKKQIELCNAPEAQTKLTDAEEKAFEQYMEKFR
jgi:hypothetical protein